MKDWFDVAWCAYGVPVSLQTYGDCLWWRGAIRNLARALELVGYGYACEQRGREIGHDEGVAACEREDRERTLGWIWER